MTIRTQVGYRPVRFIGWMSFVIFIFTATPMLISKDADSTFFIPTLIGMLIGFAGRLISIVELSFNSSSKLVTVRRPYWLGKPYEFTWSPTSKLRLFERQNNRSYFVKVLAIEGPDDFYIEKTFWGLNAETRALDEFHKLQQILFGAIRDREIESFKSDTEWKPTGWQAALSIFGLPVELDVDRGTQRPWLTWLTAVVTIAISLIALYVKPDWIEQYGFQARAPDRLGGATWLTYFLIHADFFHLGGNMYFLLVFGDNVELDLGHIPYLLLLAVATLFSAGLEFIAHRGQEMLLIGASGGIFGVVAYYMIAFPDRRFGMIFLGRWRKVPAKLLFMFFIIIQVIGLSAAGEGVAYLGHLGGIVAGVLFVVLAKKKGRDKIPALF